MLCHVRPFPARGGQGQIKPNRPEQSSKSSVSPKNKRVVPKPGRPVRSKPNFHSRARSDGDESPTVPAIPCQPARTPTARAQSMSP